MSRVVTSADIDALSRVVRQQSLEIQQTNERVARLEQQVRVLNTPSPTPPAQPPVELVNGPAPAGTLPQLYGAGLHENVIARETLMKLGGGQQEPELEKSEDPDGPGAEDGREFLGYDARSREDFASGVAPSDPIGGDTLTDSGVASDAATGVSVGGE
jgi:hypothetical protein